MKDMKKEVTKLTKQEKEKIENRLLAIFATALGSVMILLYLMNWFQGTGGFVRTAQILTYTLLGGFIAGTVFLAIKSKSFAKTGQHERAKKYNNWKHVTLAGAIIAFLVYPTEIISELFKLIRLSDMGLQIVMFINRINYFTGNPITFRILFFMILIGIYTVTMFVYYGIITRKSHKSSLNKGAKKK